ncbi:MAG: hypothetical protein AB1521_12955 [Bacteroidota bacterium]
MLHIKSFRFDILKAVMMFTLTVFLVACSDDDTPSGPEGSPSKVSGRISSQSSSSNLVAKSGSVEAAVVTLAQVQADGSLKTVSNQSVQTDASGKFVVETNLSGTKNLVVVAEEGTTKWKAIVSAEVKSGTTVYAPPLNEESTAEADIYIKVVSDGHSNEVSETDLKLLLNAEAAAQINGNTSAETQFISAVRTKTQASAQAASNTYFGFTSTQVQTMTTARSEACANLDADLYMSGDTDNEIEEDHKNYINAVLSAYASNNITATSYSELMRMELSAFTNATASMNTEAQLALAKNYFMKYSLVLSSAISQQFQAAGATSAQLNAVASAGTTLYASIKNCTNEDQIDDAFVQYHSTIKSQLSLTLNTYASSIDTLDATINAAGSTKTTLKAALSIGATVNAIVDAYVTFYNSIKTSTQTALTGASSAQINTASHILILANMN